VAGKSGRDKTLCSLKNAILLECNQHSNVAMLLANAVWLTNGCGFGSTQKRWREMLLVRWSATPTMGALAKPPLRSSRVTACAFVP
jgi:hypothetical protein